MQLPALRKCQPCMPSGPAQRRRWSLCTSADPTHALGAQLCSPCTCAIILPLQCANLPSGPAGEPHTVPTKVTGKCGSVTVRLIPAPRGAGIVAARVPKKVLQMAGIEDCYTSARGSTKTLGNFVKVGLAARQCCCTALQPVRQRGNCVPPVCRPPSTPCSTLTAFCPLSCGRRHASRRLPSRSSQM